MLEWAIACGETDPRFIDPDHPDFQASTAFPTHINAARMLPDDFPLFGSGRGIDGGKSIEWHRPMRAGEVDTVLGRQKMNPSGGEQVAARPTLAQIRGGRLGALARGERPVPYPVWSDRKVLK